MSAPKVLKHPDVHAPVNSGAGDEGGEVEISIVINDKGRVASARLSKSFGSLEFDSNALLTAHKYVFEPAQRNGKPVAVQMFLAISFRTHQIR